MPINKNHEFEEIDNIKCSIVEKNVILERVFFLKKLLELNGYAVYTSPNLDTPDLELKLFTIGVSNLLFNTTNAIFGRLLRTENNQVVTLDYWKQKETVAFNKPYYEI